MKTIVLPALFFLLAWIMVSAGEKLRLVDNGEARAVIVLPESRSPAAEAGATILGDHVLQISGATLETVRENEIDPGDERIRILIGDTRATVELGVTSEGFAPGEIQIKTFPGALVLAGGVTPIDPNGPRYAVTTFLEDQLGVRLLWPGEMGKVVPQQKTIIVDEIDHHVTPLIRQRRIRMMSGWSDRKNQGGIKLGVTEKDFHEYSFAAAKTVSTDGGWAHWHRLGGSLRIMSGHAFGHAWEKYGEEHPEWFAMAPNGSRDQSNSPHRARFCVSNRELIKALAREKIEKIKATGQKSVSIGPNDGGTTSFCSCEECEKLDAPSDRKITLIDFSPGANRRPYEHVPLTDRYIHFFNGIAEIVTKEYPDVVLGADAYSTYSAPPVRARLHPNIAIRYVGVNYLDETRRKQGMADWHAWARSAKMIFFRSNLLLAGRRQGIPAIYPHKLARDFREIAHHNMIGTDFDSCTDNWATQGLNYYVLARLLWNPDLDVDQLIDDYCQSGFGAGADDVKRYFLRLEEITSQIAEDQLKITEPYTPEVIAELRSLLDQAAGATKGDPETARRVAFLRAGLEYTDAYCETFRVIRAWEATGGGRVPPVWKEKFRVACDKNWEASRDIFINHHLAVNVATVAWGSWGYYNRYSWTPPPLRKEK